MKILVTAIIALSLISCKTLTPVEPAVITVKEYIVKLPPAELMKLPENTEDMDTETGTQATVAGWVADKESYTKKLENQLIELAKFFKEEQDKADAAAARENAASLTR